MKISLLVSSILLTGGIFLLVVSQSETNFHEHKLRNNYLSQNYSFALLGDSHFAYFDCRKFLPQFNFVNFGIGGNTSSDMLWRLNPVINSKVKHCLIIAGTNDCLQNFPLNETIKNLYQICNTLIDQNVTVAIHTIPNLSNSIVQSEIYNIRIDQLNTQIRIIAQNENLCLIELNKNLCPNGELPPQLTYDGIHLNKNGYNIWAMLINDYLNNTTTTR